MKDPNGRFILELHVSIAAQNFLHQFREKVMAHQKEISLLEGLDLTTIPLPLQQRLHKAATDMRGVYEEAEFEFRQLMMLSRLRRHLLHILYTFAGRASLCGGA